MNSVQFDDYSTALSFLREIKVGVVTRAPQGQGYQWSSDNEELNTCQQSYLKEHYEINSIWIDVDTGLTWVFETTNFPQSYYGTGKVKFAEQNDWRVPTLSELKTLRGPIKDEHGVFVKPTLCGRLKGAYTCCTPVRRGFRDDGLVWDFTSNRSSEVRYSEGKIKWGAEGGYAGFERDRTSGEGASIYVRGFRTDKLSEWAESLVRWADENQYHDFPATTEIILTLETLVLKDGIFPEYLSKLENLRKVELYNCHTAPQELIALETLEEIKWHRGPFPIGKDITTCELPDELGNLSRLTSLVVQDVGIRTLPSSIGKLRKLKTLHVKNTQLESLPDTIGNLNSLDDLTLTWNKLIALPASITGLKSLRHLTIREKNIQELPIEFGCLTKLETIDFYKTPLKFLPETFINLKKLTALSIKCCKFTALPEWLTEIDNLQSLDISFNKIDCLPFNIGQMRQLESLNFNGTLIFELPDSIMRLDKLRSLGMAGTPVSAIPSWLGEMKSLTSINVARMWCIKKFPQFDGEKFNYYYHEFEQEDGRAWLESIGCPKK